MDQHLGQGGNREPEREYADHAADERRLTLLRRYSAGELSGRETAKLMGKNASEHDVFAGIIEFGLPLPMPDPETLEAEVSALRKFFAGRKLRGER